MHELEHGGFDGLQVAFLEDEVALDALPPHAFQAVGELVEELRGLVALQALCVRQVGAWVALVVE